MIFGVSSFFRSENPQIDASRSTLVEIEMANMRSSQVDSQPQASFASAQRNQETQMSWWRGVISSIVNFLKKLFHVGQPTHSTQSENVQAECIRDEYEFILKKFEPESIDLTPYKQDVLNYVAAEQKNAVDQPIGGSNQLQKDFGRCQHLIAGKQVENLSELQLFLQGIGDKEQAQIVEALITQSSGNALVSSYMIPVGGSGGQHLRYNIVKESEGSIVVELTLQKQAIMLQDIARGQLYKYPQGIQATYQAQFTVAPNAQLTDEGYTGVSMSGTFSTSAVS